MGYRYYFYAVQKIQIEEIQRCETNKDWCDFARRNGYRTEYLDYDEDDYFPPYYIGKELYDFGKYADFADDMQIKNSSIFTSDDLKNRYEYYSPVICSQEDFLKAIESYRNNIVNYFKGLLESDVKSQEERCKYAVKDKIERWSNEFGVCPLNLDLSNSRITDSWLYEYAVFELVRLYKTFDWENNNLVLMGW